jgi:hypothetical protein
MLHGTDIDAGLLVDFCWCHGLPEALYNLPLPCITLLIWALLARDTPLVGCGWWWLRDGTRDTVLVLHASEECGPHM